MTPTCHELIRDRASKILAEVAELGLEASHWEGGPSFRAALFNEAIQSRDTKIEPVAPGTRQPDLWRLWDIPVLMMNSLGNTAHLVLGNGVRWKRLDYEVPSEY